MISIHTTRRQEFSIRGLLGSKCVGKHMLGISTLSVSDILSGRVRICFKTLKSRSFSSRAEAVQSTKSLDLYRSESLNKFNKLSA